VRAAGRAARFDLEALRQAVTISDVLAAEGIELPDRGHRMPCPIHGGDGRQAFSITRDRWRCFSQCGRGGDVFDLVQALRECDVATAIARVAGLAGGAAAVVRETARRPSRAAVHRRRARVLERWHREHLGAAIARRTTAQQQVRQAVLGMHAARDQQDPDAAAWAQLEHAVVEGDAAEYAVAALETENFQAPHLRLLAERWLAEQKGEAALPLRDVVAGS